MVQQKLVFSEGSQNKDRIIKDKVVPELRFRQFNDGWEENYLSKFFDNRNERNFENLEVLSVTINDGVLKRSELGSNRKNKDKKSMKHVLKGDLVYNPMFMWKGASGISSYEGITSADYVVLKSKNNVNQEFFSYLFQTKKSLNKFKNFSQGSLIERLRLLYPQFSNIKMFAPSYKEQEKIAEFLLKIDKKIELLEKKCENKILFKEEFFNNYVQDMDEGIQKIKLEKFITILNDRNKNNKEMKVLSISNKLGFISQEEQFEDRVIASSDKKNYKIVKKGYFAYNPARINVGSIALLKDYDEGIISPMYIVFKLDETLINPTFFENYLSTNYFKIEILRRLEGSVRLILSADSLKNIEIGVPPIEEQDKISRFMDVISKDIDLSKKELDYMKKFKQALLQKMFI